MTRSNRPRGGQYSRVVKKDDLPGALALNGIDSTWLERWYRLAGFIIAAVGVAAAFAFNALSFLGVIVVVAK